MLPPNRGGTDAASAPGPGPRLLRRKNQPFGRGHRASRICRMTRSSYTCAPPLEPYNIGGGRRPRLNFSFDDLVGELQDRLRHREAERLCGLEIDDQLESGRLLDRQIGGLGALEDLSSVSADQAIGSSEAGSIAEQ